MTLPNPSTGDVVAATHVSDIKNHLEGASGSTAPYHLRQSTGNFIITLPDAAGATKLSLRDSGAVEIFAVDSNGNITHAGSYAPATFIVPTSAAPAPTTEGSMLWDTDDNYLAVGDGAATQVFFSDNKGSDITAAATITIGTGHFFHIVGTTTITGMSSRPAGLEVILYFTEATPLTHNATSFILKEAKSRTAVPGEIGRFISEGSGNWREVSTSAPPGYVQTATQTVNGSTSLVSSSYLTVALEASSRYSFEAKILFTSNATADFKIGILGPSGAAAYYNAIGDLVGAGQVTPTTDSDISSASTIAFDGSGGNDMAQLSGLIVTGVTAGTLTIQFAQNTSDASNTSLLIGSVLTINKVA
jgi:hypothetical protein